MCPCLLLSQLFSTCAKSHANKMQEQTPLAIHPHTHFPGVKPSHTHHPSFPAFLTAFPPPVRSRHSYIGNAFPDRPNTRSNPKPKPEGKARPRKLCKDKGSILRVWRAPWFPTCRGSICCLMEPGCLQRGCPAYQLCHMRLSQECHP